MPYVFNLTIAQEFSDWWSKFVGAVTSLNSIVDIIDIFFVALIVYALIQILKKSQSIQIIKGLIFVVAIYIVVNVLSMSASKYIFDSLFSDLLIILVVVFSPEIRKLLEGMGRTKGLKEISLFSGNTDSSKDIEAINAVCDACKRMSEDKIGSLIIFRRKSLLGDLLTQSVAIDSLVTSDMVCSIFFPNAALHDGAIIIQEGRIVAARCIIPMRNDKEIYEHVGTRHRAALEVSMSSDAVVVVTSEETGKISVAYDGQLIRGLSPSELREMLGKLLLPPEEKESKKKPFFLKIFKKKEGKKE